MYRKEGLTKNKFALIAVFVYLILTVFLSLPIINNLSNEIPGDTDAFQVLARPLNLEKSLNSFSLQEKFVHFIDPVSWFSLTTWLYLLFKFFNATIAYNIVWLLSFPLAALGAYLLVKYLTKSNLAAFIGGLIFSFAPIHFVYGMGFGGATHIEWIPFMVLFLLKFFDKLKFKYFIATLIPLGFILVNEAHFVVWSLLLIGLIAGFKLITKKELLKSKRFKTYLIIAAIIVVTFSAYRYQSFIKVDQSEENYLDPGLKQVIYYSADVAGAVTPTYLHPLWGDFFLNKISRQFTGGRAENSTYLGITVIILGLIALKRKNKLPEVRFWLVAFFTFFILSLGPFLHVFGTIEPKIPMPYLLLYHYIPFIDNIRAVARVFPFAFLAAAVLAGYGFSTIKFRSIKRKNLGVIIICLFVLLEFWSVPFTSSTAISKFYTQLKDEVGDFSIIQIPNATDYTAASNSQYFNSLHNKTVFGGMNFAREKPDTFIVEKTQPIMQELLYQLPKGATEFYLQQDDKAAAKQVFAKNNVKYVIIDKKYIDDPKSSFGNSNYQLELSYIKDTLNLPLVFEDDQLQVFGTSNLYEISPPAIYLSENTEIRHQASIENPQKSDAALTSGDSWKIHNLTPDTKKLKLLLTFYGEGYLQIYLNGALKEEFIAFPFKQEYELYLNNILPGENILHVNIFDWNHNKNAKQIIQLTDLSYSVIENIDIPIAYQKALEFADDGKVLTVIAPETDFQFKDNSEDYVSNISNNIIRRKNIINDAISDNEFWKRAALNNPVKLFNSTATLSPLIRNHVNWEDISWSYNIYTPDYFEEWGRQIINKLNIGSVIVKITEPSILSDKAVEYIKSRFTVSTELVDDKYHIMQIEKDEYKGNFIQIINMQGLEGLDRFNDQFGRHRILTDSASLILHQDEFLEGQIINLSFSVQHPCESNQFGNINIKQKTYLTNEEIPIKDIMVTNVKKEDSISIIPKSNDTNIIFDVLEETNQCPIYISDLEVYPENQ